MFTAIKKYFQPDAEDIRVQLPEYTPDIQELETRGFQLLFVMGELMVGHRKHDELLNQHSACLSAGFTVHDYVCVLHKLGQVGYPITLEESIRGFRRTRVKGELFAVRSSQFISIDNYKLNGVEFNRKRIKVVVPYQEVLQGVGETTILPHQQMEVVDAWAYLGNYSYFHNFLDAGYEFVPVNIYKYEGINDTWLGEFAYFSEEEYKKR